MVNTTERKEKMIRDHGGSIVHFGVVFLAPLLDVSVYTDLQSTLAE